MNNFKNLQKLVYGDREIILTNLSLSNINLVEPQTVLNFVVDLDRKGYSIKNLNDLFKLSVNDFDNLKNEIHSLFNEMNIEGFILRDTFAKSNEMKPYTNEEWNVIFAQYSLTYGWTDLFQMITDEYAEDIVENYFKDVGTKEPYTLSTNTKQITISFNFKKDLFDLSKNILESKTVLREHQLLIITNLDTDFLINVYENSLITIKETEVMVLTRIIENTESLSPNLFNDMDQIVRIIVHSYSVIRDIENNKWVKYNYDFNEVINKTLLKKLHIRIPTKLKKSITKALNNVKDIDYTVEKMYKYYGFWKKIFTALRFESSDKTNLKYPTFKLLKDKLYQNDRSHTLLSQVEKYKKEGDYESAIKKLSENPGFLLRNIFEYLRYTKDTIIAKKVLKENNTLHKSTLDNTIILSDLVDLNITSKKKSKEHKRKTSVKKDASIFLKSKEFIDILSKTNTKLLWHSLSLFEDESLYEERTNRTVQNMDIVYEEDRPLPPINKKLSKVVKKQIKKAISKIKKEENKTLGKIFIDKNVENYNIEFSGRKSKGISLSGEYLTPGSKIPFNELLGENKILRLGIAWRGSNSCDIDHSLNFIGNRDNTPIYYGNPELEINNKTIISSSGDITSCSDKTFSVEFIDIDIDECINYNLDNMVSSAIQYYGLSFDNYEILWFMNIIDKKDRVLDERFIEIPLDKMDYAIQVNENTKNMLGFFINLKKGYLEVLNISNKKTQNYGNAFNNEEEFLKLLSNRPPLINIKKALKKSIKKSQIVEDINKAEIIISNEKNLNSVIGNILSPSKNLEEINQIIF